MIIVVQYHFYWRIHHDYTIVIAMIITHMNGGSLAKDTSAVQLLEMAKARLAKARMVLFGGLDAKKAREKTGEMEDC